MTVQHMPRSAIADFVAGLTLQDHVAIDWRIVPSASAQPSLSSHPWVSMNGVVSTIDDLNAAGKPALVTVEFVGLGSYQLPPKHPDNAFIELKSMVKKPPPLPTFEQLMRKRSRDETNPTMPPPPPPPPGEAAWLKDLVEHVRGEESTPKISLAPGLRIIEDNSNTWHPFALVTWVNLARADDSKATAIAWKLELLQTLSDQGIQLSSRDRLNELKQYNDARDQFARLIELSPGLQLKSKDDWRFVFGSMFQLIAALVSLRFGFARAAQVRDSLYQDFDKAAAVVDIASTMSKIFRGRTRDAGGGRQIPPHSSRTLGADKDPGDGAAQCKFCKKWHKGSGQGKLFWSTHRCRP
jgi:hypothetical protein